MAKKIKLLYLDLVYDYNSKDFGLGYGYYNNHLSLSRMDDIDYLHFDICDFGNLDKRARNNEQIINIVEKEKPDIMLYGDFDGLVSNETLLYIKYKTATTTLHWFCDDQWRFDSFSKDYCFNFDYCITTDHSAIKKYKKIGYNNIILSQFAANQHVYKKMDIPRSLDVSFVGQPHGVRRDIIKAVIEKGINISTFGNGWKTTLLKKKWNRLMKKVFLDILKFDTGMISHDMMLAVFNKSKINLNLSQNSHGIRSQMKGRHFEVPACGAFLLSSHDADLEHYYELGKEIETFDTIEEMIDKIKYYLSHDEEREKIARAGYERTMREHTWDKRYSDIFSKIKLKNGRVII
ncbi:MAG: glycosyltransferase [Candidatus Saganbacteria bacterium]|nr:glycosyltransferase [Candidatus Saganbacteria bacterium]